MLKFKFLLWALTMLLNRAVKSNPECARFVGAKELVFQIRTRAGAGRTFVVRDGSIRSSGGLSQSPKFTMTFRDAARGFAVLSAKDSQDAFLSALRDDDLAVSGDMVEVLWFQQLADFLKPKVEAAH
jgi:hypothetical protein